MNEKTIVITGASSGIGQSLALAYAQPEVQLLLTGRNAARLQQTVSDCQQQGAKVVSTCVDVTDQNTLAHWLLQQDQLTPIDLIIANAGCSSKQIENQHPDLLTLEKAMTQIHFIGTLNTLHPIVPRMQQRGHGQIALMSSMNAFFPLGRSRIYGALKAGLYHYGLAARAHYRQHGIQVNVICPGWVESALTDLNSFSMPFKLSGEQSACRILSGLKKNKAVIAFPWPLRLLAASYRCLPKAWQVQIGSRF